MRVQRKAAYRFARSGWRVCLAVLANIWRRPEDDVRYDPSIHFVVEHLVRNRANAGFLSPLPQRRCGWGFLFSKGHLEEKTP